MSGKPIMVLRDTGSSTVIVRRHLVNDDELTGETSLVDLVDGTAKKLLEAKIEVETIYYSGSVTAFCMDNPLYDLILGNIEDFLAPHDLPFATYRDIDAEVQQMKAIDIVEVSRSPCNFPVLLVDKPDKTKGFALHFRRLNDALIADSEPIP